MVSENSSSFFLLLILIYVGRFYSLASFLHRFFSLLLTVAPILYKRDIHLYLGKLEQTVFIVDFIITDLTARTYATFFFPPCNSLGTLPELGICLLCILIYR